LVLFCSICGFLLHIPGIESSWTKNTMSDFEACFYNMMMLEADAKVFYAPVSPISTVAVATDCPPRQEKVRRPFIRFRDGTTLTLRKVSF